MRLSRPGSNSSFCLPFYRYFRYLGPTVRCLRLTRWVPAAHTKTVVNTKNERLAAVDCVRCTQPNVCSLKTYFCVYPLCSGPCARSCDLELIMTPSVRPVLRKSLAPIQKQGLLSDPKLIKSRLQLGSCCEMTELELRICLSP